jgi:hypothetical protein
MRLIATAALVSYDNTIIREMQHNHGSDLSLAHETGKTALADTAPSEDKQL